MESTTPLIPEQRQQRLLSLLRREGVISTRDLTQQLGVSHMTVRRDIQALQSSHKVVSVQGGVRLAGDTSREPPSERRHRAHLELPRKQAIAELAASLVTDGMAIFLDAGTTCQCLATELSTRQRLTIVTNDFYVVTALFEHPSIEVIHTGGVVDVTSGSSMGQIAATVLSSITLDIAFLSTGTWSIARGVTTPLLDKMVLKTAAMKAASTCALLADSTKYGTASRYQVTDLDSLDVIVSDTDLPDDTSERVAELGIDIRLAALPPAIRSADRI